MKCIYKNKKNTNLYKSRLLNIRVSLHDTYLLLTGPGIVLIILIVLTTIVLGEVVAIVIYMIDSIILIVRKTITCNLYIYNQRRVTLINIYFIFMLLEFIV